MLTRDAPRFIGRAGERSELGEWLAAAAAGRGGLVLVAGEAGVGKSRLVAEALRGSAVRVLTGAASHGDTSPYSPVVQVLRAHARQAGDEPGALGPLADRLGVLLPELGPPPEPDGDRATLFEAIRRALSAIAAAGPTVVFLDDLHWADHATFDLLVAVCDLLDSEPLLVIGAYRSDEIPRGHPFRRFRTELRRAGRLREVALDPLTVAETGELAAAILGGPPAPSLAANLAVRSQGIPFFLEELAAALVEGGRLMEGPGGLDIAPGAEFPLPDSIRDAVLLRTDGLSADARAALEVAAVAGSRFDPGLVGILTGDGQALTASFDKGLLIETGPDEAVFRHALTRDAVYHEIPWPRRRALHRDVARHLEARGAAPDVRATHWLAAREFGPARVALIEAAESSCRLHAYRDAMRVAGRALELWPEGEDEPARLAFLDRLGHCAEMSGELTAAARAFGEAAEARRRDGNLYAYGETQRRLATVHGLQGSWERALSARQEAAGAFAAHGLPGEAATERLVAAEVLEAAGRRREALELVRAASAEAARAERTDLAALALGLEGQLRVELGEVEEGLQAVRDGLRLALEHDLVGPAAELHYRLAYAVTEAGDYATGRGAFQAGAEFCRTHGVTGAEQMCLACYAGVLFEVGEWDRASAVCRDLLGAADTDAGIRTAAALVAGVLHAFAGRPRPARRLLLEAQAALQDEPVISLELSLLWGLAVVDDLEGATDAAADRVRALRARWARSDDLYYVVHPLRWAATFAGTHGLGAEARACADALASVVEAKANPETLAALAHALGECALLDGAPDRAVEYFDRALDDLRRLGAACQFAHTQLRSAAALAAAGERDRAVERFVEAYHTARNLGAAPLASSATRGLVELGESLERRLGKRAARRLDQAGLTRRELQVLRLVNQGRSNRDIARELFLSPRTVEMHVSNALLKLGCSTRTQAAHRARELGVLA
jgi:DNA-binding CsgD family transcriptional regulator